MHVDHVGTKGSRDLNGGCPLVLAQHAKSESAWVLGGLHLGELNRSVVDNQEVGREGRKLEPFAPIYPEQVAHIAEPVDVTPLTKLSVSSYERCFTGFTGVPAHTRKIVVDRSLGRVCYSIKKQL